MNKYTLKDLKNIYDAKSYLTKDRFVHYFTLRYGYTEKQAIEAFKLFSQFPRIIYGNEAALSYFQYINNSHGEIPACTVVHCQKAPYDVYIGRPSKWGNPFTHFKDSKTLAKYIVHSRDEAVEAYREWITNGEGKHLIADLPELKNKVLGCWCHPQSCHGDVLSELVAKHCKSP